MNLGVPVHSGVWYGERQIKRCYSRGAVAAIAGKSPGESALGL